MTTDQFLQMKQVKAIVSLSPATIYRRIAAKDFPEPHRLSPQRVGWYASEIEAWLASRPSARPSSSN